MSRMRIRRIAIVLLVLTATVTSVLAVTRVTSAPNAHAATQEIDPSYANGTTVYMIGPTLITNPNPNLLAQADELYLLAYPEDTSCAPNCGPVTLPSGYQPQCDPCFHPGLPVPFVYHDHVLTGAPGFGTNGTAGSNKGPWQIIVLMYAPSYANSPSFQPVTSDEALAKLETAGDFLPINAKLARGPDPYQIDTGTVLICPLVSSHA